MTQNCFNDSNVDNPDCTDMCSCVCPTASCSGGGCSCKVDTDPIFNNYVRELWLLLNHSAGSQVENIFPALLRSFQAIGLYFKTNTPCDCMLSSCMVGFMGNVPKGMQNSLNNLQSSDLPGLTNWAKTADYTDPLYNGIIAFVNCFVTSSCLSNYSDPVSSAVFSNIVTQLSYVGTKKFIIATFAQDLLTISQSHLTDGYLTGLQKYINGAIDASGNTLVSLSQTCVTSDGCQNLNNWLTANISYLTSFLKDINENEYQNSGDATCSMLSACSC